MKFLLSLFVLGLMAVLPPASAESSHKHRAIIENPHRRSNLTERAIGPLTERASYQYNNQRATWYGAGQSACGPTYSTSDFIVALSQETFGWTYPSSYCNRPIVISYGGKTASAKIVDSCVACSQHSPWALDLTEGLFSHFADMGLGVIAIDWSFADEDSSPPPSPTHHTVPTTTKHSTTTTSKARTTSTRPSTTTSKAATTTSKAATTSKASTISSAASTTTTAAAVPTGNLYGVTEVVMRLADMLNQAV